MPRHWRNRYTEFVRYDREAGALELTDRELEGVMTPITQPEQAQLEVARFAALDWRLQAVAAIYALALAARSWRERPTDSRRGALIQFAEQLRVMVAMPLVENKLEEALRQADTALVNGGDPEHALVAFADEQVRRSERSLERCGRHAINLIEGGDRVLTHGFGGMPVFALFSVLPQLEAPIELLVSGASAEQGAEALVRLARQAGVTARAVSFEEIAAEPPTICIVSGFAAALDGGIICVSGAGELITRATEARVPCYVLVPEGPAPVPDAHALAEGQHAVDVVLPNLISVIVTDRGTYRPAMLSRYLNDGDAPLDVIPLMGS